MVAPALLLIASLFTPGPVDRDWLAGTWVWADEGEQPDFGECSGPLAITYARDGTYTLAAERGRWQLQGIWLSETATTVDRENWGNAAPRVGERLRARITRLGSDSFRKVFARVGAAIFYRCPAERD